MVYDGNMGQNERIYGKWIIEIDVLPIKMMIFHVKGDDLGEKCGDCRAFMKQQ